MTPSEIKAMSDAEMDDLLWTVRDILEQAGHVILAGGIAEAARRLREREAFWLTPEQIAPQAAFMAEEYKAMTPNDFINAMKVSNIPDQYIELRAWIAEAQRRIAERSDWMPKPTVEVKGGTKEQSIGTVLVNSVIVLCQANGSLYINQDQV